VQSRRSVPLILVASSSAGYAESLAAELRRDGNVVCITRTAEGCLRVATSIAPDVILLDPRMPERLERLLRAHPASAGAQILHVIDGVTRYALRVAGSQVQHGLTAGHHAA
jgi:CheY-like chemotaxis protein